jgi:hypothetical protein
MPLYTFFPCDENGGSTTFVTLDLEDDGAARALVAAIIGDHKSCSYVALWCGDRLVGVRNDRRNDVAPGGCL